MHQLSPVLPPGTHNITGRVHPGSSIATKEWVATLNRSSCVQATSQIAACTSEMIYPRHGISQTLISLHTQRERERADQLESSRREAPMVHRNCIYGVYIRVDLPGYIG